MFEPTVKSLCISTEKSIASASYIFLPDFSTANINAAIVITIVALTTAASSVIKNRIFFLNALLIAYPALKPKSLFDSHLRFTVLGGFVPSAARACTAGIFFIRIAAA